MQNKQKQLFVHILGYLFLENDKVTIEKHSNETRELVSEHYASMNSKEQFDAMVAALNIDKAYPDFQIINPFHEIPDLKFLSAIKEHQKEIQKYDTQYTKKLIKNSISKEQFINQAIAELDELFKTKNLFSARLKEYALLYVPEMVNKTNDFTKLSESIINNKLEFPKNTMGGVLGKDEIESIKQIAQFVIQIQAEIENKEHYLELLVKEVAPNTTELCGAYLAARFLSHAGDLRKLSLVPSSTIQVFGAEKALFRHLKTKAKPPKYGYLLQHPLVSNAKHKQKGKIARVLADQISIAAKVDYFKGEYIADKLQEKIKTQIKRITRK